MYTPELIRASCTKLRELGGAPPLVDYEIWVWSGSPAAKDRTARRPS